MYTLSYKSTTSIQSSPQLEAKVTYRDYQPNDLSLQNVPTKVALDEPKSK